VGAATAKLREPKHVCGHVGQPTNYSLMNEVYETEKRIVSIQSEDRHCRLSSRDSFVSNAGDLKLDRHAM